MKKSIFIFLILVSISVRRGFAQSSQAMHDSTVTAHYIRPADVLSKDIRWNKASSDLFTYWVDNELYGFYGPQPEILIDGLPIDANYFGWQNLNMLPIDDLQKTVYSLDPQVYDNNISPAGFINFQSVKIDSGLSVNASFYVGNETGDPGPYNYDSLKATPNIDRWGPDGTISLAYKKNNWYAKGTLVSHKYTPTDLASNARLHFTSSLLGTNNQYVNHPIYTTSRSGLLETGYKASSWQVKARAVSGISKDYLFLQPFGREIPVKTGYNQIALRGTYSTGDWDFTGRYIDHRKSIDKRFQLHSYIFDWKQRKHTVGFSAAFTSNFLYVKPGFTLERLITHAPGLSDSPNNLATFSLDASVLLSADDSIKVHINTDYNHKEAGKTLGLSFPKKITNNWKMVPSVTYTEVLPIHQNSFSYWINRGYTFADELNIPYTSSVSVRKNQLTIFKLRNRIKIAPHLILTLQQQLLNHQTLNIPYQPVEADEYITDTQPGRFSITQEKGNRLALYSKISYSTGSFRQSLALNIQHTLSGTERYKKYFGQIPDTKINYSLNIYPTSDLILSLNALYRTSTTWDEFEAIEGDKYRLPSGIPIRDVTGTFHYKTPVFTNISVGIKKWFWNRRIGTQFSIRNLLNEEVRMHPLGDELATKFDIMITLNF